MLHRGQLFLQPQKFQLQLLGSGLTLQRRQLRDQLSHPLVQPSQFLVLQRHNLSQQVHVVDLGGVEHGRLIRALGSPCKRIAHELMYDLSATGNDAWAQSVGRQRSRRQRELADQRAAFQKQLQLGGGQAQHGAVGAAP